nr:acyl-CoA carboxylase subunit epsilon [Microbacterium immunditiarum]
MAEHDDHPISVEVLRGHPAEEELAALVAVVTEAYTEEASHAVANDRPTRSAWSVSQRPLRQPLPRELGWSRALPCWQG